MYLLDTNVISELREPRSRPADRNVLRWTRSVPPSALYLSVVSVLELELGMLQVDRRDPIQGQIIRVWIEEKIIPMFAGRVLAIDLEIARRCAALHVPDPRSERDAYIAATALVHGMTVVTRNTVDFAATGVPTLNPWEA
jgi:predicted nucleic acid-binding protein